MKITVEQLIEMKETIKVEFGEDSFEAGYIQWVFSRRSTETFVQVYEHLMQEAGK